MAQTTSKPRYRFCWVCSRQLRGPYFAEVVIDGEKRIVHKSCAQGHPVGFESADQFNAFDGHGSCPEDFET